MKSGLILFAMENPYRVLALGQAGIKAVTKGLRNFRFHFYVRCANFALSLVRCRRDRYFSMKNPYRVLALLVNPVCSVVFPDLAQT